MNERNTVWNDDLKMRLIKAAASQQLGISGEDLEERLSRLAALLPGDLLACLLRAPVALVARAAAHTGRVAHRLVELKDIFPRADCSVLLSGRLSLLLDEDLEAVRAGAARLRQLLPDVDVDKLVESYPMVLDLPAFERALEDCRHLLPGVDPQALLRSSPSTLTALVKGSGMIPYDQLDNPWS